MAKSISQLDAAGTLTGDEVVEVAQPSDSVTMSATTISAQASDNSLNDSGNGFVAAGFAVNDRVKISGFTGDAANNIFSAKITALTSGKMTFAGADGDVIVDDAAGEVVTITKWVSVRRVYNTQTVVSADGASAEVYELRLSADQSNVTGDGTEVTVAFDTEAASRDWASTSSGEVTLNEGCYLINASAEISGGSTFAGLIGRIRLDGLEAVSQLGGGSTSTQQASATYFLVVDSGSTKVVEYSVAVSGDSLVGDIVASAAKTYLRITRLPVSTPVLLDGISPEVFQLTLSGDQNNVTGNGVDYKVPFDVVASSLTWASNLSGTVTLQPGTYLLVGSCYISGGSAFTQAQGKFWVNGVPVTNERSHINSAIEQPFSQHTLVVDQGTTSSVEFHVQVNGGAQVGDVGAFNDTTFMRITRLPAQAAFSGLIEYASSSLDLGLGYIGKWLKTTHLSGCNITVQNDSAVSWPDSVEVRGHGSAAMISFIEDTGVTINVIGGSVATAMPNSLWMLKRIGANEWLLVITPSGGKHLIEEITLTSGAPGEFDFDNIPQGFNRLVLEGEIRSGEASATQDGVHIFFNSDTTVANYFRQNLMAANGVTSTLESSSAYIANVPAASSPSDSYAYVSIAVEGYAGDGLKQAISKYISYQVGDSVLEVGMRAVVSKAITDGVTRIQIASDGGDPSALLFGTARLYGEF